VPFRKAMRRSSSDRGPPPMLPRCERYSNTAAQCGRHCSESAATARATSMKPRPTWTAGHTGAQWPHRPILGCLDAPDPHKALRGSRECHMSRAGDELDGWCEFSRFPANPSDGSHDGMAKGSDCWHHFSHDGGYSRIWDCVVVLALFPAHPGRHLLRGYLGTCEDGNSSSLSRGGQAG